MNTASKHNTLIKFDDITLIKSYCLRNTCLEFFDDAICTYMPLEEGTTVQLWSGASPHQLQIYTPGTFVNVSDLTKQGLLENKRDVLILETGYMICISYKKGYKQQYNATFKSSNNIVLPPHTKALILDGSVEFTEGQINKKAEQYNLIKARPYQLNLIGQANIVFFDPQP